MKKTLFILMLSILGQLFALEAHAQTAPLELPTAPSPVRPEVARRIERALFIVEGEAPASFFVSLGVEGREALVGIALDRGRALGLRRRAVLALHHYADARVRAVLGFLAADPTEDAVVSRYAVRTLGLGFGAAAFEALRLALSDPRPMVREGAALALFEVDEEAAAPVLAEHLAHETEAFVRATIERALR